jgi:cytochrome c oxidase subunit 2
MAARSRLRGMIHVAATIVLIGLLAGCMLPPQPKTDAGQDVFNLYLVILALGALVFIGVEGFILYAVIRYRRQPGDDVLPPQTHGNTLVEIIWTVIPSVIVVILFVTSVITLNEVEERSDEPGVTVDVEGFQWQWTFRYPEGVIATGTAEEPAVLTIPVGEPVRLRLDSTDVIHAFYVPQFLIKRDVVPVGEYGRPNELEFTVTEEGTYTGQCAEFCGSAHADMTFVVDAVSREEYDAWFAAAKAGETPPPSGDCATTIQIAAANLLFDIDSFEVPAGEDFCIEFANNDTTLHDVAILDGGTELFNGEDVPGGESITYFVPALAPGEFRFICTFHPREMVGDVTVTE